jgi:hypothetical protein
MGGDGQHCSIQIVSESDHQPSGALFDYQLMREVHPQSRSHFNQEWGYISIGSYAGTLTVNDRRGSGHDADEPGSAPAVGTAQRDNQHTLGSQDTNYDPRSWKYGRRFPAGHVKITVN